MKSTNAMRNWMLAAGMLALLLPASNLSAQKMGYMNSIAILSEMPEIALADTAVMKLRDSLYADGEVKAKALQEKYLKYVEEVNQGTVPPKEAQVREEEIAKGQEELQQYEQQITNWLGAQREILYNPALDRLQKAIDDVGKENQFQFIFDVSTLNFIVYAEESVDVTPLVRAKLGLKE